MDITPLVPAGRQIVESYGGGGFRVTGQRCEGAILVFPDRTLSWAAPALTPDSLATVLEEGRAGKLELLLLGCGQRGAMVPPALRDALRQVGVAVEAMDTGAACRTYNVLMADGRRLAAALMPVG